tara:strand:- start:154 stop:372 length:219 start_codon:yes stop_codon:yes gene_type:complete
MSRAQSWASARNRSKGQIGFMIGTLKSIKELNVLAEKEEAQLQVVRRILVNIKSNWEDQNSTSRQQFLDTWD